MKVASSIAFIVPNTTTILLCQTTVITVLKFLIGRESFFYKFGNKESGDGEFNDPGCLSVDRAGHLLVCDLLNHRVQVFKLSGEFVTKFGAKGTSTLRNFYLKFGQESVSSFQSPY